MNTYFQVRTTKEEKESVNRILSVLGTNISAVTNMMVKQIILTKRIPFDIGIPQGYTPEEAEKEVRATMAMEGMPLSKQDLKDMAGLELSDDKEKFISNVVKRYKRS